MTTSEDVQNAIEAVAKSIAKETNIDDVGAQSLLRALRTLAAHIDDVAQLPVVTAKLINDVANRVAKLEANSLMDLPPAGFGSTYATPPGFEVRSFAEAASFGGWTLGYHEEVGEFILRKTEDGDMPGSGFKWIAPAPQPDAQKLVVALISEGFSVAEVEGYARNAVSRALEKCR